MPVMHAGSSVQAAPVATSAWHVGVTQYAPVAHDGCEPKP
jgi:hypothetical protein